MGAIRRLSAGRVLRSRVLSQNRVQVSGRSRPETDYMVGVRNFSPSNFLQSIVGGGEQGIASGFGCAVMFRYDAYMSMAAGGDLLGTLTGTTGTWAGWYLTEYLYTLSVAAVTTSNVITSGFSYTFTPSDVGRVFVALATMGTSGIQLMVNRVPTGAVSALASYLASATGRTALGARGGSVPALSPTSNLTIMSALEWRGTPSIAQREALFDAARVLGDLPDTMAGVTVTHEWSAKRELAKLVDQSVPTINDNITLAQGDALVPSSAGLQIVKFDPTTIDGRRTFGAQGFSNDNGLTCSVANPGVVGTAAGFTLTLRVRWDSVPTGNQMLAVAAQSGGATYWFLRTVGAALTLTASSSSSAYTVTSADLGKWNVIQAQFTGTVVRLLFNGVQVGADVATGIPAAPGAYMRLGYWPSQALLAGAIAAASGGNYVASLVELRQQVADTEAAGRLVAIPGMIGATPKTEHLWDLSIDVVANGVEAVPAQVLDRVGTDHLTRVGLGVQKSGSTFLGIGPYANNVAYWKTQVGGGIQGGPTMHAIADVYFTRIPTSVEHIVNTENGSGWYLWVSAAGVLAVGFGGIGEQPVYTLVPGDLNRTLRIVFNNVNKDVELWVNGVNTGHWNPGSFLATANAATTVGQRFTGTNAFVSGYVKLLQGGSTTSLTAGEIATSSADLTQPPPVIAGKTQRRYLFETDATAVSGVLPGRSVERLGGANLDDMALVGSGLTLAQLTERGWSYETSPIEHGVNALTDTDYLGNATAAFPGHAAGCWYAMPFIVDSQSVAGGTRILTGCENSSGWDIRSGGTNSTLTVIASDGGGVFRVSPTVVLSAADVGKLQLLYWWWDGAKLHVGIKRAEVSTGTSMTGYTPADAGATFKAGRHPSLTSFSATGIRILGGMGGNGSIPSTAEFNAAYDAFFAREDLVEIPGKTDFYFSIKQDVVANGGVLPSTFLDRKGGKNLSRFGAPALASIYTRAAAA